MKSRSWTDDKADLLILYDLMIRIRIGHLEDQKNIIVKIIHLRTLFRVQDILKNQ